MHAIFAQQAQGLSMTAEGLAKLTEMIHGSVESSGSTKSWKKRFFPKHQEMVLNASVKTDKTIPMVPTEEYQKFVESNKANIIAMAQSSLNTMRGSTQVVDNYIATMLYNGTFVNNDSSDNPKGLSIFFSVPPASQETSTALSPEELELLVKTHTITPAQIQKVTMSQIRVPNGAHEFLETLENFLAIISMVFGEGDSFLYKQLHDLFTTLKDQHIQNFKSAAAASTIFLAEVMAAIDARVQAFLKSCALASDDASRIEFDALDFSQVIKAVQYKYALGIVLPVSVALLFQKATSKQTDEPKSLKRTAAGAPQQVTPDIKAPKKQRGQTTAKNTTPADVSWIVKGEYPTFHKHLGGIPKFRGKAICAKYHLMGVCTYGDSCQRKESHTGNLDATTKKAMDKWVEQCREGGADN
jgi:hypothetical protein